MARGSLLAGSAAGLLVLGVADLLVLNYHLAPAAWPPGQTPAPVLSPPPQRAPTPSVAKAPSRADAQPVKVAAVEARADAQPVKVAAVEARADAQPVKVATVEPKAGPKAPPSAGPPPPIPYLHFPTGAFVIPGAELRGLNPFIAWLKRERGASILIRGHADQRGSAASNERLSLQRAMAVANYMVAHGVGRARIRYEGHGSNQPVDPGNTPDAWAKNRRVEIQIQKD